MQARWVWHVYAVMGLLWGLGECAMGLWLCGACGRAMTGSIMTGLVFFHLSAVSAFEPRRALLVVPLGLAAALKATDALWLGLPLHHGAVVNPIMAFILETGAFLVAGWIWPVTPETPVRRFARLGAAGALLAALAFPLAGFATGNPACLDPGTGLPLAWVYAPVAILIGAAAAPLGAAVGRRVRVAAGSVAGAAAPLPLWVLRAAGALLLALFALNRVLAS